MSFNERYARHSAEAVARAKQATKPGHDDSVSYLRILANETRDDYRKGQLLKAARELEQLRHTVKNL